MRIRGNRLNNPATISLARSFHRPSHSVTRRHTTGAVAVMSVLCVIAGMWTNSGLTPNPPASHTVTVPGPTVTVTKTVYVDKPVQVATFPADCMAAIQTITKMQDALATVTSAAGKQVDILSAAHVAILTRDIKGLTKAGNDQNQLKNDTSDARRSVSEAMDSLTPALDRCNTALQDKPLR